MVAYNKALARQDNRWAKTALTEAEKLGPRFERGDEVTRTLLELGYIASISPEGRTVLKMSGVGRSCCRCTFLIWQKK